MINKLVKSFVFFIGILLCLIVFILNIIYVSTISNTEAEIVNTEFTGIYNILIVVFLSTTIAILTKKMEKIKIRKIILILFIIIYSIAQIYWINIRQATPAGDQGEVYSSAVKMYENKWDELRNSKYLEMCPQQITISAIFCAIFKIFSSTNVKILQYANVISNVLTILAIILICKNLKKQYKINMSKTLILIGTFFTLPLLSTFVYGDLMSIPMCLFAIYFIMKYGMEIKKRYAFISAIFMAIGYAVRMNNLIFIIALAIYLILNIIKQEFETKDIKLIAPKVLILLIFIAISMMPATILRNSLQSKMNLDKNKQLPTVGYLYIGMQESYRANGWYSDYATWAWDDVETSKEQYKTAIKERIKYFVQNPGYFVKFYTKKVASMWTENTYACLWYNQTFNFKQIEGETEIVKAEQLDELIRDKTEGLLMYQKALMIIIFATTIAVLIKKRNKLSDEIILLLTIFIGGFLFHILWEAKSRYIIPYILVLIPIASIDNWKRENNEK